LGLIANLVYPYLKPADAKTPAWPRQAISSAGYG
jgi:hypothetical protein